MNNDKKIAIIDLIIFIVSIACIGGSLWALYDMKLTLGLILSLVGILGLGWLAIGITDMCFRSGNGENDPKK